MRRRLSTALVLVLAVVASWLPSSTAVAEDYADQFTKSRYESATGTIHGSIIVSADERSVTLTLTAISGLIPRPRGAFVIDSAGHDCQGGFVGGGGATEMIAEAPLDMRRCYGRDVNGWSVEVTPVYPVLYKVFFYESDPAEGYPFSYPYLRAGDLQFVLATGEASAAPTRVTSTVALLATSTFVGSRVGRAFVGAGVDTAQVVGDVRGVSRVCSFSRWTARTRYAQSSTRLLWNGKLAEELAVAGLVGEVERTEPGSLEARQGLYHETVTLKRCGPPSTGAVFKQTMSVGTQDRTLQDVSHSSYAELYDLQGQPRGKVDLDETTTDSRLRLDQKLALTLPVTFEWYMQE